MAACLNARYGLWTNGDDRFCFAKRGTEQGGWTFEEIVEIPGAGQTETDAQRPKRKDLKAATADNLLFAFRRCPYKPVERVYPWVDLHPDGRLRSIYSGKSFDAEEFIRADAEIARQRSARLQELTRRESTLGPREYEAAFDTLERELPFNCEHVVPQSWFSKREPMRGDLHHLFACESSLQRVPRQHAVCRLRRRPGATDVGLRSQRGAGL